MEAVLLELAQKIPELLIILGLIYFILKWQYQILATQQNNCREDYQTIKEDYEELTQKVARLDALYEEVKKENQECKRSAWVLKNKVDDVMIYLKLTKKRDDPKPEDR